jgi:hypothetical protein
LSPALDALPTTPFPRPPMPPVNAALVETVDTHNAMCRSVYGHKYICYIWHTTTLLRHITTLL